jgi:hypothetical protein
MYRLIATLVLVTALAACVHTPLRVTTPAVASTHKQCIRDYQFANCNLTARHGGQLLEDCRNKAGKEAEQKGHACCEDVAERAANRVN